MSRGGTVRALASAMLLLLPAMLAGSVASPAYAAPGDPGDVPVAAVDTTMDWKTLGLESDVTLGPNSPSSFTVPVPAGLAAQRVRGTIRFPMNIGAGYLEVDDGDGKFLGTVDLPPAGSAQAATPFDIDISAARVRASSVDLSFTVRPVDSGDKICGPLQQVELSDLTTVFSGTEQPATTIANFFPGVLERVTVYAPADAGAAEQQSVLTLVATLPRIYQPQPLAVTVVTQPRGTIPAPAPQLERAIVVETGPVGLTVENAGNPGAYLRVSGRGDELTTQVSLLVNDLQTLAQASAFRVDQAGQDTFLAGDTLSFDQLKMTGKTDVLRTSNLSIGVDRAALGAGRVDSVQVHLLANYTPVPKDDTATVLVHSNGFVVYRALLDSTGLLDATFTLDRPTFGQYVRLEFALTYTPRQQCGALIAPISFQVDPRSTLTMHRGGPPLGGFGALPSEFSPSFKVALDGSGPNQLVYAAKVVTAIARMTGRQLTPEVVDLKTAVDATSGTLIVARSSAISQTSLNPPLGGDGTGVDVGLPTELRANMDDGLGSIQAFADKPRNRTVVLVTTTSQWSLVDPLLDYLGDTNAGGWSRLSGDVLAAGQAGTPTNLAIRGEDTVGEPGAVNAAQASAGIPWVGIGVGVAVVAIGAALAAAWLVRRRRTRTPS
ncbi:MAG: hypothetical protein ABWY93_15985 [Mycobacterium sp.]